MATKAPAATARAAVKPASAPEVTGDGAVPPIVREKPREVTSDLIAQLAAASREAGLTVTTEQAPGVEVIGDAAPPEPVVVPVDETPPPDFGDEEADDDTDEGAGQVEEAGDPAASRAASRSP